MMKRIFFSIIVAGVLSGKAFAIPQEFLNIGGGGAGGQLLADVDHSEEFLDPKAWADNALPGSWRDVPGLVGESVVALKALPKLYGAHPQAVYASADRGKLKSISILYVDAGSFFGYEPADGNEDAEAQRERKQRIRARQSEFRKRFKQVAKAVEDDLKDRAESKPSKSKVGRTPLLSTDFLDYESGIHVLRYARVDDHAITLTIVPKSELVSHYMDDQVVQLSEKERRRALEATVTRGAGGDVSVDGVPVFRQGQMPYCAINTLGMVTHHFGLRLGVTGLAAGAKFKNTGSARGSKLLDLYRAAAEESGMKISRSGNTDFARIKRAIDDGCPVLVWRRYGSNRDRLHSQFAAQLVSRPNAVLPEVTKEERATWPDKSAPGHTSVITGYNEARGEVIFMESWGEQARNRRMRVEEMEDTSYMTFYFKV